MDREAVIYARNEDLQPCPFCGGRPKVVRTSWDWGPFDLRHVEIRCQECEAHFTYDWRTSPYKYVPHAIEWWNTRATTLPPPETIQGYYVQDLVAIAELLKCQEITPNELTNVCNSLAVGVQLAQRQFAIAMDNHLKEYIQGKRGFTDV